MRRFLDDWFLPMAAGLGFVGATLLLLLACIAMFKWMFGPTPEQQAAARIPVAISSADGCTVYRFEDAGMPHYFTRCGGTVTTTKNYTESCGKGCSRNRQEHITTEGNK